MFGAETEPIVRLVCRLIIRLMTWGVGLQRFEPEPLGFRAELLDSIPEPAAPPPARPGSEPATRGGGGGGGGGGGAAEAAALPVSWGASSE